MALFSTAVGGAAQQHLDDEELFFRVPRREQGRRWVHEGHVPQADDIHFNVSGAHFRVSPQQISLAPPTCILHRLDDRSVWYYEPNTREYILDRNSAVFRALLVYVSTRQLHLPPGMCRTFFRDEIAFMGVSDAELSPCCVLKLTAVQRRVQEERERRRAEIKARWKRLYDGVLVDYRKKHFKFGMGNRLVNVIREQMIQEKQRNSAWLTFKRRSYAITDGDGWEVTHPYHRASERASMAFTLLSLAFIVLSTVGFCMETLPEYRLETVYHNCTWQTGDDDVGCQEETQHSIETRAFVLIEIICVVYFTVEVCFRGLVCPNLRAFFLAPMTWVDILSILPFYVLLALNTRNNAAVAVRLLRLLRIFRIFKSARLFAGLRILAITVKMSWRELLVIGLFVGINMILFASAEYYVERGSDLTPFNSITTAFWWAIITMTTVGYGDMVPATNLGRFIGAICAIAGVLTVALPMPVFVNRFTELYEADKRQRSEARERKALARKEAEREARRLRFLEQQHATEEATRQRLASMGHIAEPPTRQSTVPAPPGPARLAPGQQSGSSSQLLTKPAAAH
eukprot:m.31412 g.31412  ORF g.31412 m.31412 type:complete len:571 (+) comp4880_c0_seq1:50-1762(+)